MRLVGRVAGAFGLRRGVWERAGEHHATGSRGERLAEKHLKKLGYRVLRRNAMLPGGEVDLLCEAPDRRTIVLVEVKARRLTPGEAPPPEAAITHEKAAKLRRLGERLKRANGWTDRPVRIDVVAVELAPKGEKRAPVIRHHENAVGW